MEPGEYARIYQVENRHWWYAGMQSITRAVLNGTISPGQGTEILDAGCGTGAAISTYLADYGNVTGFDISPIALKFCRERNLTKNALASVMGIPFRSSSFDIVTCFDVLYERAVTRDDFAMAEFFRVLRPEGFLLLRLPAYNWLRGQHDKVTHTARRYTTAQVAKLLKESGFRIIHLSYANTFLFPLAIAKRLLEPIWQPATDSSDLSLDVGAFNPIFSRILSSEAFLITRTGLPFGLSVIALGKKPKSHA